MQRTLVLLDKVRLDSFDLSIGLNWKQSQYLVDKSNSFVLLNSNLKNPLPIE